MKKLPVFIVMLAFLGLNEALGQWNTSGNDIFNTNTGNVGIGNSSPSTLLHVGKNMTEPTITVQNLGGIGGATYTMMDNVSGANWKFKATNSGGFKIRDHANSLDVFVIEPNSAANAIYINGAGNVGIGENTPAAALTVGNGDKFQVDGLRGNLTFTDDSASIKFPSTTGANQPMIFMFNSGTSNSDRMLISHSPSFPKWGIEYHDTSDVIYFRNASSRLFTFELSSGQMGIKVGSPDFPLDIAGRMRLKSDGSNNLPGIWFSNQGNTFDRAFFGMDEPDSCLGIWSQHLNKWAIEFEIMREPRIGINIKDGSPPRAELHLYHTNFGGSNDGVRIQNEGLNGEYWNLYTSNTTGDFELYQTGIKRATINATSGVYTAISDERLKTNIGSLGIVLPKVMSLQPKTYQFVDGKDDRYFTGFVAQELEQLFPQFVYYGGDDQVLYTVDYGSMSVIALKAIQEQQVQIDELKKEIQELKALIGN